MVISLIVVILLQFNDQTYNIGQYYLLPNTNTICTFRRFKATFKDPYNLPCIFIGFVWLGYISTDISTVIDNVIPSYLVETEIKTPPTNIPSPIRHTILTGIKNSVSALNQLSVSGSSHIPKSNYYKDFTTHSLNNEMPCISIMGLTTDEIKNFNKNYSIYKYIEDITINFPGICEYCTQ